MANNFNYSDSEISLMYQMRGKYAKSSKIFKTIGGILASPIIIILGFLAILLIASILLLIFLLFLSLIGIFVGAAKDLNASINNWYDVNTDLLFGAIEQGMLALNEKIPLFIVIPGIIVINIIGFAMLTSYECENCRKIGSMEKISSNKVWEKSKNVSNEYYDVDTDYIRDPRTGKIIAEIERNTKRTQYGTKTYGESDIVERCSKCSYRRGYRISFSNTKWNR